MVIVVSGVVPPVVRGVGFYIVWPCSGWVSVAFGEEVESPVLQDFTRDSMDDGDSVRVAGILEDDYVAVRIVGVKGFGIDALNHDKVAKMEGTGERVRPTVACAIVRYAHAAA